MGTKTVGCLFLAFMCGRTACTLAPDEIVRACTYKDKKGKKKRCEWKDAPGGQQYRISYNMAPGAFTPVLLSSKHFNDPDIDPDTDHVVMPMKWGLVPGWHKESPSKYSFKTSNCRGESMLEKATYKTPLIQGRRCVAVMDGFYEWKTTASGKQPYFFQFLPKKFETKFESENQPRNVNVLRVKPEGGLQLNGEITETDTCTEIMKEVISQPKYEDVKDFEHKCIEIKSGSCEIKTENSPKYDEDDDNNDDDDDNIDNLRSCLVSSESNTDKESLQKCSELKLNSKPCLQAARDDNEMTNDEWRGQRLLTCAAVYDVWRPSKTCPPLYSYSVITVASSSDMAWCHHRMPAVLSTDQEVCDWLDFATIPLNQASKLIEPKSQCLSSHPVSKNMNNSSYQFPDCLKPIDLSDTKKQLSGSGKMMMNWLKRSHTSPASLHGPTSKSSKP